jgi:curved DNA-binding protein
VREGQRIRLAGQGAGGADLFLKVKIVADDRFRLKGDDVYTTLRISPHEAVLGGSAALETLDGTVKVKIPPGSSTGRQIRLRERGYPTRAGGRGDLYAEVQIAVPPKPTDEERALYEQLAAVSRFDPRA